MNIHRPRKTNQIYVSHAFKSFRYKRYILRTGNAYSENRVENEKDKEHCQ